MMQWFTSLPPRASLRGTSCIRVGCVIFILLLPGKSFDEEAKNQRHALPGFYAGSVSIVSVFDFEFASPEACVEAARAEGGPYSQREDIHSHLQVYNPKKANDLVLDYLKQRAALASAHGCGEESGRSDGTKLRTRCPRASVHQSFLDSSESSHGSKATPEAKAKQVTFPEYPHRRRSSARVNRTAFQQKGVLSSGIQSPERREPPTHTKRPPVSPVRNAVPSNIVLHPDTVKEHAPASHSRGPDTPGRLPFFPSLSSGRAPRYSTDTHENVPSAATGRQTRTAVSIPTSPPCTRGLCERDPPSFVHTTDSSQNLLPWLSRSLPSECQYAGCKAGTFRGRRVSDKQDCFSFTHCTRCPLYPLGRADLCSKIDEEGGYLLLMQTALQSMHEPVLPFHYRPPAAAAATPTQEQPSGTAASAGEEEEEYDEEGSVSWSFEEGGGRTKAATRLLQPKAEVVSPRHRPRVGETLPLLPHSRRREQSASAGASYRVRREAAATTRRIPPSILLEEEGTSRLVPLGGSEAAGENEQWTEREVQLGQWRGGMTLQRRGPTGGQASDAPAAEILKFEQSRTYRTQPGEIRADLSECAASAKGTTELLLVFVFQPSRPRMSVQEARQRLGLVTAGIFKAEERTDREESWDDVDEADYTDISPPAYIEHRSLLKSRVELAALKTSDSPLQQQPRPPAFYREKEPDFWSTTHSSPWKVKQHSTRTIAEHGGAEGSIPVREKHDADTCRHACLSEKCVRSRLSVPHPRDSWLQSGAKLAEGGDFSEEEWPTEGKRSGGLSRLLGKVKRVFRRRGDEDTHLQGRGYGEEEMGADIEYTEGRTAAAGGKVGQSPGRRLLGRLWKRKSPQEKQETKEKKQATRVLVHAPRIHLEVAVASPAVRRCRKVLEWTGRLRLSTMIHVQYVVTVRTSAIQGQLPGFVNNALRVMMRCESKRGCVLNRDLQSCVLVSCAKHKVVSREAAVASSKAAEALARSQLKLAQSGSGGILSEEERSTRAALFLKTLREKQHAVEAEQLQEHQQILSAEEQHRMLHQQLAKFADGKPDAMQRRLLEAMGVQDPTMIPAEGEATSPVMKEAKRPVSMPKNSAERRTRLTPTAIAVLSVAGLLSLGASLYWCFRRK